MAEEILAGELRMGHSRYDADWRNIERTTQRSLKGISDAIGSISKATSASSSAMSKFNREMADSQRVLNQATRSARDFSSSATAIKSSLPNFSQFNQGLKDATASLGKLTQELNRTKDALQNSGKETSSFAGALTSMKTTAVLAAAAIGAAFVKMASEVVTSGEAMLGVRVRLEQATGSAEAASRALAMVTQETTRLGQSTIEGAKAFTQIATAAKGTVAEGEGAALIFKGISTAMSGMGLSADQTNRILLQMTQTMNKGRFQGEELTAMAENNIPAYKLLADAMKITTTELTRMLQAGDVSADNMLLLAVELLDKYSAASERMAAIVPAGFRRMAAETANELATLGEALFTSQTAMEMFSNATGTIDFLPDVATMRGNIDETLALINEFIGIVSLGFYALDEAIKAIWAGTFGYLRKEITAIADYWSTALDPVDKALKSTFDKIISSVLPESSQKAIEAWRQALGTSEIEKAKETVIENAEEMGEAVVDAAPGDSALEKWRAFKESLEVMLGTESIDLLNPQKTGEAVEKSGNVASEKMQRILAEIEKRNKESLARAGEAQAAADRERLKNFEFHAREFEKSNKALYDKIVKEYSDSQGRMTAEQEREAKRRLEYAEDAIEQEKNFYIDLDIAHDEAMQAPDDNAAWLAAFAERQKAAEAYKQELIDIDMYQDELSQTPNAEGADIPQFTAAVQGSDAASKKIVDNFKDNVQEGVGDVISNALRSDLDNIADVFDIIKDIGIDVAGDIASAFVVRPIIEKGMTGLMGETFVETGDIDDLGGSLGGLVDKINDVTINLPGGGKVTGGQLAQGGAAAVGGFGAGYAVGGVTNQALGGGNIGMAGSIFGGAVSGAMAGAPFYPPYGAIIGAVAGAIGGLISALQAGAEDITVAIAPITTAFEEGVPQTGRGGPRAVRRGPFGFISLDPETSGGGDISPGTVATLIAEADSAISRIMTERMREVAAFALQGQPFEVDAREVDDAIAQTIQTRYFVILREILRAQGDPNAEATTVNIVGEEYSGTSENIGVITTRMQDALEILKLVEEIQLGDIGQLAQDLRAVDEQFSALASRARELGLESQAVVIEGEGERVQQEMAAGNLRGLQIALAEIEDPALAAAMALEDYQEELWKNAVAADAVAGGTANQEAAQRLFAAQWKKHAEDYDVTGDGVVDSTDSVTQAMNDFIAEGTSPLYKQVVALDERFQELQERASALGLDTAALVDAWTKAREELVVAANIDLAIQELQMQGRDFEAAMWSLAQTTKEVMQMVEEGILDPEIAARFLRSQEQVIVGQEAVRIGTGGEIEGPMSGAWNLIEAFKEAGSEADTLATQLGGVAEQVVNLNNMIDFMLKRGELNEEQAAGLRTEIAASAAAQAERIRAEWRGNIEDFIDIGLMSSAGQQLSALNEKWQELRATAIELGMATDQLDASYEAQRAAIAQPAIDSASAFMRQESGADPLYALDMQFSQVMTSALELNAAMGETIIDTDALTASYLRQRDAMKELTNIGYAIETARMSGNNLAADMLELGLRFDEIAALVASGALDQGIADAFMAAATAQVHYAEAMRIASGETNSIIGPLQGTVDAFISAGAAAGGLDAELAAIETQFFLVASAVQYLADKLVITQEEANAIIADLEASRAAQEQAARDREIEARRAEDERRRAEAARAQEEAQREKERKQEEARRKREEAQRRAEQEKREAQQIAEQRRSEAQRAREEAQRRAEQRRQEIAAAKDSMSDFIAAGMSSVGQQLNSLKNQYQDINEESRRLGLSTGALTRAYRDQRAEIIRQARVGLQQSILSIVNPFKSAMLAIREEVRELQEMARDGVVSMRDVRRYEREAIRNARYQEASRLAGGGGSPAEAFFEQIRAFQQSGYRSGPAQGIFDLTRQYNDLRDAMKFLGLSTKGLTKSFLSQVDQVRQAARTVARDSINSIIDPFTVVLEEFRTQLIDFQKQVGEGILRKSQVARWRSVALEDALMDRARDIAAGAYNIPLKYKTPRERFRSDVVDPFLAGGSDASSLRKQMDDVNEAGFLLMQALVTVGDDLAIAEVAASIRKQTRAIGMEAHSFVNNIIWGFGQPLNAALAQADAQIKEVQQLFKDGLIFNWQAEWATKMIKADTVVNEALRRISGGPVNSIEEVANAFDSFIRAGNPMSDAGQRLYDLTETFVNLADAAHLLDLSTAELEESYLKQAQTIREEAMQAIEDQLSEQISGIETIKEYLDSLKISAEQPGNVQISEAQRLFNEALAGDDVQAMVSSADDLRSRALDYYGTTEAFYAIERSISSALETIRAREEAAVAAERERLTQQLEREIRQLEIGINSLDQLQRIRVSTTDVARGIDDLITLARLADRRETETNALLRRLAQKMNA
jgi:tape measure domain-containing protein